MLDITGKVGAFKDECLRTASWQEMEGLDEGEVWRHLRSGLGLGIRIWLGLGLGLGLASP